MNATDILGATPLHKAAALGKPDLVSILLSKQADVNRVGICYYFTLSFLNEKLFRLERNQWPNPIALCCHCRQLRMSLFNFEQKTWYP